MAPMFPYATDRQLVRRAGGGVDLDEIDEAANGRVPEAVVRLVEMRLGALGRIRPAPRGAAGAAGAADAPFQDVTLKRSAPPQPQRQESMLSLVALALGDVLQRLGDRLYIRGAETTLPHIVRLARQNGVRIRYPGLDPIDATWSGGPSRKDAAAGGSRDLSGIWS